MKNQHEVGHFKTRLMILSLSLVAVTVMAGESIAATTCSTCHGMPPLDDTKRNVATGGFVGSHQKHVSAGAVAADCVVCHSAAAGYTNAHSATSGNVIGMSANISGGTYSKGASFAQTATPTLGTCSNVSCHADPYSSSTITSPIWGTPSGCAACHSAQPITANGPATGSHTTVAGHAVACTTCHAADTSSTATPSTGHADGNIDVANVGYPADKPKGSAPASCSAASCHPNVYGTGSATTPVWGTTGNGCSACHTIAIGTNGPATGAHNKHAGIACTVCHAAGTTATTQPIAGNGHVDGNIDIFYFSYPADVPKHAPGSGYGTCSTANCHSNGAGTYTSPNWGGTSTGCTFCHPTLSAGHTVHTNTLLSEVTFYGYTSNKSVGATYKFGCGSCHTVSIANHMNGSVDIDLAAAAAGGSIKLKNGAASINGSKQCLNVYCHSNGYKPGASYTFATTPAWGGSFAGDRCAACHGNSPSTGGKVGSSAHAVHTVGIHYTDIYNGVSRKLPQAGGNAVSAAHGRNNRSTTINCNMCHALTVSAFANDQNSACVGCHDDAVAPKKGSAAIADKSKHVNGTVDISFINQKLATKAQVANAAFASHTASSAGWTRNNNIYKAVNFVPYTSAYDVTKSTLFAAASYNQANGCLNVACHSGITVKWTDTVTCTSCHTRLK